MKFPEINTAKRHTLHIPSLTDGLDTEQNPHTSQNIGLEECENVWIKDGLLKTRLGLDTTPDNMIKSLRYSRGYYHTFKDESFELEVEGELKHVVTEMVEYDISTQVCMTHYLNADGTLWGSGQILFSRVSDDVFYIPQKIQFFKGKPQSGKGAFAFVQLVNCENYTQTESRIYELKNDYASWEYIYSTYIPTVLINGRGNRYEFAKGADQAFSGTPTKVEGLNILNHSFFAYYTTDSYSTNFRLPFSGISNKAVAARLYYTLNTYAEWHIPENENSAEATVYDAKVTMHIDRQKGIVYFTVPAGPYEVPLTSEQNENNLRITASVDCEYSLDDLAFSNSVLTTDKIILVASGNTVFEASCNNPLYFPVDSITKVGNKDSSITKLEVINDSVFAFKENEVYSLEIKAGKKLSDTSLLADSTSIFYLPDTIDTECISRETGCKKGTEFVSFGDSLYWIAADYKVHKLSASQKLSVTSHHPDIKEFLRINEYSNVHGAAWENKCIFTCENRAVLIDFKNQKRPKWFYWSFPDEVRFLGAHTVNGALRFICFNTTHRLCFSARLSEGADRFLYYYDLEPTLTSLPITTYLRTEKFGLGCDNTFKKVDFVTLNIKGECKICINGRYLAKAKQCANAVPLRLTPVLCETNTVDISVSSQTAISLGSIDIGYTELDL